MGFGVEKGKKYRDDHQSYCPLFHLCIIHYYLSIVRVGIKEYFIV